MKTKQVLCISLITSMLFLLLTGCGGKTNTNVVASTENKTEATSEQATETEKEPVMVLTANLTSQGSKYYTSMSDASKDKYIKKIEELTNIRLDITVREHSKDPELVNLMFASGEIPDLFHYRRFFGGDNTTTMQAIKNGLFKDIKQYINVENTPNLIKKVPEGAWEVADILKNGSIYFVPLYKKSLNNSGFYIREDLLKKYKLEVPETLDDFTNVLRVFKKNGVKYPLIARQALDALQPIFGAFGVEIDCYIMTDEGKIEPAAIQPGMKEALRYIRSLYEERLLDPEFLTNSLDPFTNKILNGDVGIFRHGASNYASWQDGITKNVPDAKFKMILGPVGPNGKSSIGTTSSPVDTPTFVSENVKEPARVVRFFDWMCTEEAEEFFAYGIEGDTYTKTADGKINFTYPTTTEGTDELWARTLTLCCVGDVLNNPLLSPYIPYGELINKYRNEVMESDCVIHQVNVLGSKIEVYQTSPELECSKNSSSLFQQIAIKIIFGEAEVDEFDNWVKDWRKRGGDIVLEQLEEKRASGEYAIY